MYAKSLDNEFNVSEDFIPETTDTPVPEEWDEAAQREVILGIPAFAPLRLQTSGS